MLEDLSTDLAFEAVSNTTAITIIIVCITVHFQLIYN